MKKLNQYHFYYGAILNAVLECNLDASPTLLEVTDKRGVYKIITNTSKREYIMFCKYAFQQDNKTKNYQSWKFYFSEKDKKCLQKYYDEKYPVFIYFLCGASVDNLIGSEIAVCTYEEYCAIMYKRTITIGIEKNKSYFNLHTEKQRSTAMRLSRERIRQKSDAIIDEVTYFSPEHYTTQVKEKITIDTQNTTQPKVYEKSITRQQIRFLSLSPRNDNVCPIHIQKMKPVYVHIGKQKDTAYYCPKCGKYMISSERYLQLIQSLDKKLKNIQFEAISENIEKASLEHGLNTNNSTKQKSGPKNMQDNNIIIHVTDNPKSCECNGKCVYELIEYIKNDKMIQKINVAICPICGKKYISKNFYDTFIKGNQETNIDFRFEGNEHIYVLNNNSYGCDICDSELVSVNISINIHHDIKDSDDYIEKKVKENIFYCKTCKRFYVTNLLKINLEKKYGKNKLKFYEI